MALRFPGANADLTLEQGALVARSIDRADRLAAKGNLLACWEVLRPFAAANLPLALAGRFFERVGECALAGLTSRSPQATLTAALHAYQQEHDVPGMARVHAILGSLALASGELEQAGRELGYAEKLASRGGRSAERVNTLCRQAEVALLRGDGRLAAMQLQGALELSRLAPPDDGVRDALEAQVQSLLAHAATLCGSPGQAARALLWSERLASGNLPTSVTAAGLSGTCGAALGPRGALGMLRAETLVQLGFARRARVTLAEAGVPAAVSGDQDRPGPPRAAEAHVGRLLGAALLLDAPAQAVAHLEAAEQQFARLHQGYHRAFCQVMLVRAARRASDARADHFAEIAGALRLARWPQLARLWQAARDEPRGVRPTRRPSELPWVREIGRDRHRSRARPTNAPAAELPAATPSLLGRLTQAVARRPEGSDP